MTTTPTTTRRGPGERLRQWWEGHAQLVDAALALLLWLLTSALAVVSMAESPTRGRWLSPRTPRTRPG